METKEITAVSFYEYLGGQKLMGTRCTCGNEYYLPPRPYCPHCEKETTEWHEFSGKGKLVTYTVVFIGPSNMVAAGYDSKHPYCVGVVELEEGPRVSAMITGVDPLKPAEIQIGAPVTVDFTEIGPEGAKKPILAFRVN